MMTKRMNFKTVTKSGRVYHGVINSERDEDGNEIGQNCDGFVPSSTQTIPGLIDLDFYKDGEMTSTCVYLSPANIEAIEVTEEE